MKHPLHFKKWAASLLVLSYLAVPPLYAAGLEADEAREAAHQAMVMSSVPYQLAHDETPETQVLKQQILGAINLPEETKQNLYRLGFSYFSNIYPTNEEDGSPLLLSMNEYTDILRLLAGMEEQNPGRNLSRAVYNLLADYFPTCCFENQQYYLTLFQGVLIDTDFSEPRANTIIDWARAFMRPGHTDEECTEITRLVQRYVLENPDEVYETSPLQAAFQEEEGEEDDGIIPLLQGYLFPEEEEGDEGPEAAPLSGAEADSESEGEELDRSDERVQQILEDLGLDSPAPSSPTKRSGFQF